VQNTSFTYVPSGALSCAVHGPPKADSSSNLPAPPCTQCLYKISSPAGISSIWPIEYRFIASWGHTYIYCPFHLPNITNHLTRCSWCSARLLSSGAVSYVPILPARHYPHNYPFYSKMRFFYFLVIVFYLENQKNFYNYP
jgi:hypothetical protein